jgi:lysophospholipase L1-like esterase
MTPPPAAPLPTFFVVGDSFAADLHEAGDGWGSALARYVNPAQVRIRNASLAGVSSRTYRTRGHWDKLLAQVHAGDVVFLQFNENEAQPLTSPGSIGTLSGAGEEIREIAPADGRRETVHTQGWYLRSYIQDVRSKGATPMLLTSTPKNAWTSYEQVGRGHWKEAPAANGSPEDKITSAIGQEQKVPVIDLARLGYLHYRLLGRELVGRLFDRDGGHLNRYGADLDAYLLVSGLKGIPDLAARGIWSTEGALVIPATTEVNIPILTDWYDTDPPLPVGATGPSSHVILTTVNPGPDFAALYGDGQFSEGNTQPANADLPSIFMIGDEAVRGGRGIGAGNQWGWGDLVGRYLDPTKVNLVVRGIAGSSSRNFITQGTWLALRRKIQRRDFVLIEFGHYEATPIEDPTGRGTLPGAGRESVETTQFPHLGDLDTRNIRRGRETVYTYGAYLRTYVAEVKKSGALPILISPTPRNRWKDGKIVREPELVRQTAEVAKEAGVPFFDLHTLLADRYDAMGQPAAERCFADPEFATHYVGARLAAESIVKLLLVQNPDRIRNFLNPTIAVTSGSTPLEPATVNPAKSYWQVRADYRTIDKGMSRADVVARLGAPDRTRQDLSIYWRQGPFSLNRTPYMELDVSYNREDRVAEAKFREGTDRDTLPSPLP